VGSIPTLSARLRARLPTRAWATVGKACEGCPL